MMLTFLDRYGLLAREIATTFGIGLLAYLSTSAINAIVICRWLALPDPRYGGSTNPGTVNVLRLGGRAAALCVLTVDGLKGFLPIGLGKRLGLSPCSLGIVAIAAVLGHLYPIFFRFKGGKGVATTFGALSGLSGPLSSLLIIVWLLGLLLSGYASVAALLSALLAPLGMWWLCPTGTLPMVALSCLVLWRHRDNLRRLRQGAEPRIGSLGLFRKR